MATGLSDLGMALGVLFGGKTPEQQEEMRQKALLEAQNKARLEQLREAGLIDDKQLEKRLLAEQKLADARIAAQRGLATDAQTHDANMQFLTAADAAARQQAGFKQQRDMSIDEEIAAGERALLMRDLQKQALLENPELAAKGFSAAAKVTDSDAEVQQMRNRLAKGLTQGEFERLPEINLAKGLALNNEIDDQLSALELAPGKTAIEKNKQSIMLDPSNKALIADTMLGINLGQGDTRFSPNNIYTGTQRGSGIHRLADGTLANGDYTIQPGVLPKYTRSQLEALKADKALIEADSPKPVETNPFVPTPKPAPLSGTRLPAGSKVAEWEKTPAAGEANPLAVPRDLYGAVDWGIPARRDYGIGNYINLNRNKADIEKRLLKAISDEISSGVDAKTKKELDPLTRNFLHNRSNALYNATQRR